MAQSPSGGCPTPELGAAILPRHMPLHQPYPTGSPRRARLISRVVPASAGRAIVIPGIAVGLQPGPCDRACPIAIHRSPFRHLRQRAFGLRQSSCPIHPNHRRVFHARHDLSSPNAPFLSFPPEAGRSLTRSEARRHAGDPSTIAHGPSRHPASTRVGINTDPVTLSERR